MRRLGLALASALGVLLAAEIGLRILAFVEDQNDLERAMADELPVPVGEASLVHILRPSEHRRIIYEQRPDLDLRFQGLHLRTNAHGFRDKNYEPSKPARTVRIVGLGDSIMWGWRLREADTFLSRIEKRLNQEQRGVRWDVINTAVNGYNTAMEVESFERRGLAFEPDLVVLAFCQNDLDLPNYIRPERRYAALDESYLWAFFGQRFRRRRLERGQARPNVISTLGLAIAPMAGGGANFENDPRKVPERYRDLVGWDAYGAALERLAELAQREGFEVAMIFFRPSETVVKERALERARELGFWIVDTGARERAWLASNNYPLTAYHRSPLVFSPSDLHPTALLNEITSAALLEELTTRGWLARVLAETR